jgi:hypothetical protein
MGFSPNRVVVNYIKTLFVLSHTMAFAKAVEKVFTLTAFENSF